MFKWPSTPSVDGPKHELADFAELVCWREGFTSATELSKRLGVLAENDYGDGVPEEEDVDRRVEEALLEIERRREACRDNYPFEIVGEGSTLQVASGDENPARTIYKYLLLSTRLNMNTSRLHAGIDGTLLLERLSAMVAKAYFGERAESIVFGTAQDDVGFRDKVDDLCGRLGEGGGYTTRRSLRQNMKDGRLDIVAWIPFGDELPGKLIGFGQCKTGTNYRDDLTELQPDGFVQKWMRSSLIVPPVRMFFVSEALGTTPEERFEDSVDAGLLFDRCRIVDLSNGVDEEVLQAVHQWTSAAAVANDILGL